MSPKGLCVKGLAASLWHYWEVVEPLRGRSFWKEVRPMGCDTEGDIGTCTTSPLSHPLDLFHKATSLFCHTLGHDFLPCHWPKSSRTNWLWTETSDTVSHSKPFLLISCFISSSHPRDGKLPNTKPFTLWSESETEKELGSQYFFQGHSSNDQTSP
jgi:hypothetical protein